MYAVLKTRIEGSSLYLRLLHQCLNVTLVVDLRLTEWTTTWHSFKQNLSEPGRTRECFSNDGASKLVICKSKGMRYYGLHSRTESFHGYILHRMVFMMHHTMIVKKVLLKPWALHHSSTRLNLVTRFGDVSLRDWCRRVTKVASADTQVLWLAPAVDDFLRTMTAVGPGPTP